METVKIQILDDITIGELSLKKNKFTYAYIINNEAYVNVNNTFYVLYKDEFVIQKNNFCSKKEINKKIDKLNKEIQEKQENIIFLENIKNIISKNKIKDKTFDLKTIEIFNILNKDKSNLEKSIEIGKIK